MITVYLFDKYSDKLGNNCYVLDNIIWVIEVNNDWMIGFNGINCLNNFI